MSSDFTINSVPQSMMGNITKSKDKLGDMIKHSDGSDPMTQFKIEMQMSKYTNQMKAMAAIVGSMANTESTIIQKIN